MLATCLSGSCLLWYNGTLGMFFALQRAEANIWMWSFVTHKHQQRDLHTQTHTEQSVLLGRCFPQFRLIKFPFLLLFSKNAQINLGHIGQVDVQVQNSADPRKQKNTMTFCSLLAEVWQTVFIPNNSCVEEMTLLERQMIGETQGWGR